MKTITMTKINMKRARAFVLAMHCLFDKVDRCANQIEFAGSVNVILNDVVEISLH